MPKLTTKATLGVARLWLCAATLCLASACTGVNADLPPSSPSTDASSDPVELRVRRGAFVDRVLLTGMLEATRAVRITPPRTPTWQVQIRWLEEDGARVTAGQKVLELDNTAFVTDLEQKKLDARKEDKEIQQQKAQSDARAAELGFAVSQRRNELDKAAIEADVPQDLIPLREYQEKQLALERARTAVEKAEEELRTHRRTSEQELDIRRATLEKTRYDIRVAERAISELELEAPTDGVLIVGDVRRENRKLQVGDTVWPGYVVARIPDLSEMQVEAQLSDVDDGRVRVGDRASVRLDSYPEIEFPGYVRDLTPVAQETSPRSLRRAFRVRVALERTDEDKMRPGMAARVVIDSRGGVNDDEVLLVPRAALSWLDSQARARLAGGEHVALEIGPCNAMECVVLDGLEEGARLESREET